MAEREPAPESTCWRCGADDPGDPARPEVSLFRYCCPPCRDARADDWSRSSDVRTPDAVAAAVMTMLANPAFPAYRHPAPERDAVAGFQWLIRVHPNVLPAAPAVDPETWIGHRTKDEIHGCLRCESRARVAFVADTVIGNRWLDLCPPCAAWFLRGNDALATENWMNGGLNE